MKIHSERQISIQHFVKHHPKTPNIYFLIMNFIQNHFWRNIVYRTTKGLSGSLKIWPSKISNFYSVVFNKNVFRFQISMDNGWVLSMEIRYCFKNLSHVVLSFILGKNTFLFHYFMQRFVAKFQKHVNKTIFIKNRK